MSSIVENSSTILEQIDGMENCIRAIGSQLFTPLDNNSNVDKIPDPVMPGAVDARLNCAVKRLGNLHSMLNAMLDTLANSDQPISTAEVHRRI